MNKPYRVIKDGPSSVLLFRHDVLRTEIFNYNGLCRIADMMNGAYANGVSDACACIKDRDEANQIFDDLLRKS